MQREQTLELIILLPPTAQVLGLHEGTTMSYLDICYKGHCYLGKSFDSNLKLLRLKLLNVLKSTPFKCMGKGIELRLYRPGILE